MNTDGALQPPDRQLENEDPAQSSSNGAETDCTQLNTLANESWSKFQRSNAIEDLNDAIHWNTRVSENAINTNHNMAEWKMRLGTLFLSRAQLLGQLDDTDSAIENFRSSMSFEDHPDKPACLNNIGAANSFLYARLGKLVHIHSAIDFTTQAVVLTSDSHYRKPGRLGNLAHMHYILFERTGELSHLHNSASTIAQAIALVPDSHPDKPGYLNNLGITYRLLFQHVGALEHIHNAISSQTKAVVLTPDGHPDKPGYLGNTGNSYMSLFERTGKIEQIKSAIDYCSQAVSLTPEGHMEQPGYLNNLGNAYRYLFQRLGNLEDVQKAAKCHSRCVTLTDDSDFNKCKHLINLGNTYRVMFDRLGDLEYIHNAVEAYTQGVSLAPDSHPNKPGYVSNLGGAYQLLFDRLGEPEYLYSAVAHFSESVKLVPDGHPEKPAHLNNLGHSYRSLFEQSGELEHIHKALACHKGSVALVHDDHPHKPLFLNHLGSTYEKLFDHFERREDIQEAISCFKQAVDLTPNDHQIRPSYLFDLGVAYYSLSERLGPHKHIGDAISYLTQAAALTPESHPRQGQYLSMLGMLYLSFHRITNQLEHAHKSIAFFQRTISSSTSSPNIKLQSSRMVALFEMLDISARLEAYNCCLKLLPEVVWLGTSMRSRYKRLIHDIRDLVSEAAVAATMDNRHELALEWLEQGRCVVWSQMLQLRTPLDSLRASHPELLSKLRSLSEQLDNAIISGSEKQITIQETLTLHDVAQMSSNLADKRDKLIKEIRMLPGFHDFLCLPKAPELISYVQRGAVVILNIHKSRCDAVIIQPDANPITSSLNLSNFSFEKAEELRRLLASCLQSQGIYRGFRRGESRNTSMRDMLAVLWLDIVKPVLDYLGINRTARMDDLPHIAWCITGPLSFLPIHAAGIYDNPDTTLSNLAISSYIPNISSMARSRSVPESFSGMLAVGLLSSVRGLDPLPGVKSELDKVQEKFTGMRFARLEEAAATADTVLQAMADHSWVHFACHASQDPSDPLKSSLHLYDKELDLATISTCSMKNAQLAFLSACQTATGDSVLPDEVVHLAAGLLMAGYPNVIATMWSISDEDAPVVSEKVYGHLLEDVVPDSRKSAKALHLAVKHLQDKIGIENFVRWVPYIHIGS